MADPKLIFLGTGGDALVIGKQMRASGGFVLSVDDTQLHVDPGPGSIVKAAEYGVPLRNTTAVIVTNTSLYRCNDVNAVVDAMTLSGFDRTGVLVGCKEVISGDAQGNVYIHSQSKQWVEKCIALDPGGRVGINALEIRALPLRHSSESSIGLKIFTSRFVMGYTSDTAYSADLVQEFKDVDLLLLHVVSPGENKIPYSLCTEDAKKIIAAVKPKLALLSGFGIKMLNDDPLEEARSIQRATGVETLAAKDGMVLNLASHSVNLRQRTLNLY